jgi:hypothetical protein
MCMRHSSMGTKGVEEGILEGGRQCLESFQGSSNMLAALVQQSWAQECLQLQVIQPQECRRLKVGSRGHHSSEACLHNPRRAPGAWSGMSVTPSDNNEHCTARMHAWPQMNLAGQVHPDVRVVLILSRTVTSRCKLCTILDRDSVCSEFGSLMFGSSCNCNSSSIRHQAEPPCEPLLASRHQQAPDSKLWHAFVHIIEASKNCNGSLVGSSQQSFPSFMITKAGDSLENGCFGARKPWRPRCLCCCTLPSSCTTQAGTTERSSPRTSAWWPKSDGCALVGFGSAACLGTPHRPPGTAWHPVQPHRQCWRRCIFACHSCILCRPHEDLHQSREVATSGKSHMTPILRDSRNTFLLGHGNGTKSHRLQFSCTTGRLAALEHTLPTSTGCQMLSALQVTGSLSYAELHWSENTTPIFHDTLTMVRAITCVLSLVLPARVLVASR